MKWGKTKRARGEDKKSLISVATEKSNSQKFESSSSVGSSIKFFKRARFHSPARYSPFISSSPFLFSLLEIGATFSLEPGLQSSTKVLELPGRKCALQQNVNYGRERGERGHRLTVCLPPLGTEASSMA